MFIKQSDELITHTFFLDEWIGAIASCKQWILKLSINNLEMVFQDSVTPK